MSSLPEAEDDLEQPLFVVGGDVRHRRAAALEAAAEQRLQHEQETLLVSRGTTGERSSGRNVRDEFEGLRNEGVAFLDLPERQRSEEQVVANLEAGWIHLPGAGELTFGLGKVALLQR